MENAISKDLSYIEIRSKVLVALGSIKSAKVVSTSGNKIADLTNPNYKFELNDYLKTILKGLLSSKERLKASGKAENALSTSELNKLSIAYLPLAPIVRAYYFTAEYTDVTLAEAYNKYENMFQYAIQEIATGLQKYLK